MDLRCFIAIDLTVPIKNKLGELIDTLKKHTSDIKWVMSENLHLTLKFLGNTPEERIPEISGSLLSIISSYKPFYIKIYGTGVFPNKKTPRVIWAGVQDAEILRNLKRDIEKSMSAFGYEEENKEFTPHLTLGRVRSHKGMISIMNELSKFEGRDFGTIYVNGILLMKSELKPKGPEYTCLKELRCSQNI
jgi:2'-5' RNA ligase